MKGYHQLRGTMGERRPAAPAPAAGVQFQTPPPASKYFQNPGEPRPRGRADKAAPPPRPQLEVNKRLLIVAISLSAVASLLAMSYLQSSAGVLSQKSQLVPVVVATRDIPARTVLKAEMFGVREVPAAFLVQGALGPKDDFLGKLSLTPLYNGEQILRQRVSSPNSRTGLTSTITAGFRALTIDVSASSGMAGLLKPGDMIDLISTIRDPYAPDKVITTPIMQRAKVLAVGSRVSTENGVEQDISDGGNAGQTVTLAVPEKMVNVITMLEARGNLKMVLRSAQDETVMPTTFSAEELEQMLLGQKRAPATPPPEPPPTPAPRPRVVVLATPRPYIPSRPVVAAPRPVYIPRPVTRPPVTRAVVQKTVHIPVAAPVAAAPPPRPIASRSIEIISGTRRTEHKVDPAE